ncbi:MAG: helix-turn-helix domain-containing protein [Patescibacteria group bacterium]|nr:helix-turn-helix domain-containing protein [Patescibacteria group bacterium]
MPQPSLQPLEYLGLDESSVKVYLANLALGKAGASELARRAKLTRTSVYRCLEKLADKGLVHKEILEGKNFFRPVSPDYIPELIDRQVSELSAVLPWLEKVFTASKQKAPSFRFYGEASGIRTVLEEVLRCKSKSYDIFGSVHDDEFIYSVTEKYLADWMRRRIKAGVYHRSLRPQIAKRIQAKFSNPYFAESGKRMLREIRYAPPSIKIPVLIYLFDDKVAFVNGKLGRQFAAILESKEMFESLESLFQYLWEISELDNGK